jgi:hypothetical protein
MLSMIANSVVFARRFGSAGQAGWAVYSVLSAVAIVLLVALTNMRTGWAGVIVALAGAVSFGWVSAVTGRLRAE